jgi:hypothetical protein
VIIISLLDKLEQAVNNGIVNSPFTTSDVKNWITKYDIKNDDTCKPYKASYIDGFCSSSVKESNSTKYDKRLMKIKVTNPQKYEFE